MIDQIKLDENLVAQAKAHGASIASDVLAFVQGHTTVAVERTICRLLGIDGVNQVYAPYANVLVEHLKEWGLLSIGAAYFIAAAHLETKMSPQEIAEAVDQGQLQLGSFALPPGVTASDVLAPYINQSLKKIAEQRAKREEKIAAEPKKDRPLIYCIVATGNIYEDITQSVAAARQGADIIAVIRTTGQSLLDYVPYGATTEGFGGTYATQENFRLMRQALDQVGEELGRYIRLTNYCSGLCMPEIAAMGALERLDMMLNDALYGILFRDINMQRTLIDQHFSRQINAVAGIIINTGEDNYLTTADAVEEAHTVIASQILNEQLALAAGLPSEQMGLGHAFEIDPNVQGGFVLELAHALLSRSLFPQAPLKYMPPTKFMTGNIFKGQSQNTMFNIASYLTGQNIHLLGMLTEAIHTPFMSDRALSIENALMVFTSMAGLAEELEIKSGGKIEKRAQLVLEKALELLEEIDQNKLFHALEKGVFADISRSSQGGKGLDGVAKKDERYENPFSQIWS
ncbi:MAG: D-lysine 5,6-aminomutase subunit alpha [Firmicutes bacterium]|jgi:beta-lysine 5,6-aminomutase alpha subunit|nr:D-lysine 5,6-aminomutase subunit alpha [Bacillota bacterium]